MKCSGETVKNIKCQREAVAVQNECTFLHHTLLYPFKYSCHNGVVISRL